MVNGVEVLKHFPVVPVPKPRMTAGDRFQRRPPVVRYWKYKDKMRALVKPGWKPPNQGSWLVFVLPMAKSWSKKRKRAMLGQPHMQKPDKDNLEKAFLDIWGEDQEHWDGRSTKIWGREGSVYVLRDAGGTHPLIIAQAIVMGTTLNKRQLYSC